MKQCVKGYTKEYVKRQYNNANVKGAVDVAKHIRSNIPFMEKLLIEHESSAIIII